MIREAVPAMGGQVIDVDPARTLPTPQATVHGHTAVTGLEVFRPVAPATCVFKLKSARAIGPEGFVLTPDDTFLYDASFWSSVDPIPSCDHPIYRRKKSKPIRALPGTCLSLATDFSVGSYGHMIHDGLARWRLLTQAGFGSTHADWILFPRLITPNTEAIADMFGLPRERVLNCSPQHDWEFDTLIGTSYPAALGTVPPETALFLREFGQHWRRGNSSGPRVYLSRRGYQRNPDNLDEIEAILREFDFQIVDANDGEAVLIACANATVVAGIDGSNMASLAFAPAGSRVLIINPPVPPPQPYHTTMAFFGGRELHLIAGDPLDGCPPTYQGNFHLPPSRLRSCLARLCAAT